MVVRDKLVMVEPHFLEDLMGMIKSAHDAMGITRERWLEVRIVLEFDIKGPLDKHPDMRFINESSGKHVQLGLSKEKVVL